MDPDILFTPSQDSRQRSAMWQFSAATAHFHGGPVGDYSALQLWSIREPEQFHACLWDSLNIIGVRGDTLCSGSGDLRKIRFFPDASLNYAENLLHTPDDTPAIIAWRDDGTRRMLTRAGLAEQVSRVAQALRQEGVGKGARVAAIVTNDIEAIIAYLATASIGAIWASCSPDFGPVAATDRLSQVDPCVLFAVSSYRYANKTVDVTPAIVALAEHTACKRIVLVGAEIPAVLRAFPCVLWQDWLSPFTAAAIDYERLPFSAPLAILFSSGTTGKPKCIVHSAGGLLLQHKKELMLHCDLKPGERFFYFTTCGWMMWNWLVSGLAVGATLVTFDGNPFFPRPDCLPDLIDKEAINVFGTSARYLHACAKEALHPRTTHRLEALRLILSTGSPLLPASFDYVYRHWKTQVDLASISGGTDICACFLGGNPLLPVRRGELKCAMLGMDVDTLDDNGKPVAGAAGELVCRNAHVSMPVGFWGDNDGARYHEAYFTRFPGLWAHGDFAERTPGGGWILHGRSDTTLNPGGVRIGTAEIYRQVETIEAIQEAIAVGQDKDADQRVILFVRLRDGVELDDALRQEIRSRIRSGASPRHVPACIIAVTAIPRTRSGKISEQAVRDVIHGRPFSNTSALENPEALELYRDLVPALDK